MKAEERHRLKTNELAESLAALPGWFKANGRIVALVGGGVVLLLVVAVVWWQVAAAAEEERSQEFARLLARTNIVQFEAVNSARLASEPAEGEEAELTVSEYNPSDLAGALGRLASEADGEMAALAMLEEAELVRSRLYYSHAALEEDVWTDALGRADSLYDRVAGMEGISSALRGRAMMGQGLVAEERGEWERAEELYGQIAEADGLAGTAFPSLALRRLAMLEELKEPVNLPAGSNIPVEEPEVAEEAAEAGEAGDQAEGAAEAAAVEGAGEGAAAEPEAAVESEETPAETQE